MFDQRHRGVTWFGNFAEESAHVFGARDALAILEATTEACIERPMQGDQATIDALTYLARHSSRYWCETFWRVLSTPDPQQRMMEAYACLHRIRRYAPCLTGRDGGSSYRS